MAPFHNLRLKPSSISRFRSPISAHGHTQTVTPTSAYYDELIHSALRSQDFSLVRRLLHRRIQDGCFNTTNTFKFITATSTSLSLLDPLFESLSLLPKGLPRKNAFDSLIARLCKLRLPDLALRLFDEMRSRNLEISTVTFHPVLNSLSRMREIGKTVQLLKTMKDAGVPPDTTAYNYLLTAYCADGDLSAAAELLTRMREEEGLEADSRTYDAMVLGACRVGKVAAAVVVLRKVMEMEMEMGLLYSTPSHIVNALVEMGYYAQAVKFVVGVSGRDKALDTESFGMLATRLFKLERFQEARFVLGEMERRGLPMGVRLGEIFSQSNR